MNAGGFDFTILGPALAAGLLVSATHVPLGIQVLRRGIVFIDLAIAQIAGFGVIFADWLGFEPHGALVQVFALLAALAGALLLTWTDRRWPEVQEAIIGVTFVLAATGALLLLAANPRGGEHLKDLLVGQVLWVTPVRLLPVLAAYAVLLFIWLRYAERIGRIGFYLIFAVAVTLSVQLVGLYLVFATLIVPALATRYAARRRLLAAYAVSVSGYLLGLVISAFWDLPSGPAIVWMMTLVAALAFTALSRPRSMLH